jgi:hypothetical protein
MSTIRRRKQAVVKADTLEALLDGPPVPDSPEVKRLRVAMFAANYNIPLVDAPRAMREYEGIRDKLVDADGVPDWAALRALDDEWRVRGHGATSTTNGAKE